MWLNSSQVKELGIDYMEVVYIFIQPSPVYLGVLINIKILVTHMEHGEPVSSFEVKKNSMMITIN